MPIKNYGVNWKFRNSNSYTFGHHKNGPLVNFEDQVGIYVLHKRDDIVYVGRNSAKGLFGRLVHHSKTKKGKWDSFSWFGLKRVLPNGDLADIASEKFERTLVISDIEALLIYLLEPRLNGAPGKHKHIHEYIQVKSNADFDARS